MNDRRNQYARAYQLGKSDGYAEGYTKGYVAGLATASTTDKRDPKLRSENEFSTSNPGDRSHSSDSAEELWT